MYESYEYMNSYLHVKSYTYKVSRKEIKMQPDYNETTESLFFQHLRT